MMHRIDDINILLRSKQLTFLQITLFSAMQSVIDKMKALEHVEKYVEKVKEDSANGELEILAKVEEMKQIVARTKEANDMHAGEVYGEKAILATETRELQSRLLSLSEERDKSLSILDEVFKTYFLVFQNLPLFLTLHACLIAITRVFLSPSLFFSSLTCIFL
ncbi:uncharacterized protein LOC111786189 [Cucurbita pepo subsp. pepo]|uniref:uncharacterized protein LOC111786189 n=1 Tax=Cucurbita pepo subsp. pepo TaxID=3664 RepID=UPI000C9D9F27|nr:uncharacterized protein LOC111786189 [Cucurbita pepo subsp. pepo]